MNISSLENSDTSLTFRATTSTIVMLLFLSAFAALIYPYFRVFSYLVFAIMLYVALNGIFSKVIIKGNKLIKRTMYFWVTEIEIDRIKIIEAIAERKLGYIHIQIGRNGPENYYILVTKENRKVLVYSDYTHRGISVGRYLKKNYRIKFNESRKMESI